jgi:hypothetical protein
MTLDLPGDMRRADQMAVKTPKINRGQMGKGRYWSLPGAPNHRAAKFQQTGEHHG